MILIIIQSRGKQPLKRKKNVRIAPSKKCKVSSLKVFLYFVFQSCQLHPLCVIQIVLASSQDFTFFRHARPLQHHFEFLELARPWGHHLQIGLPFVPNSNQTFITLLVLTLFIAFYTYLQHFLALFIIKMRFSITKNAKMQLISLLFDQKACPAPKLSLSLDLPGPRTSHPFFAQTPGVPGGGGMVPEQFE